MNPVIDLFTKRNEARMFERFTDAARQVVVIAQKQAGELGDNYIGTEHLVLGLIIAEEGRTLRVLTALGANKRVFRETLAKILKEQPGPEVESYIALPASQQPPFTPRAKRVLELSLREALSLGHNYIGIEHILLGLVRENEGVGVRVLEKLGIDLSDVRDRVIESFHPGSPRTTDPLEALERYVQRAKEQAFLALERLPKDDILKRVELERIESDLEKAGKRLEELKKRGSSSE